MKILSIAQKTLREYWREPLLLGLIFAFPILLIFFYDIAFGETEEGLAKYLAVLVLDEDAGTTAGNEQWPAGGQLIAAMRAAEFEDSPLFDVSLVGDRRAAEIALREHKAALLLIIPPDFTQTLLDASIGSAAIAPAVIVLAGNPTSDSFVFARSLLEGLVMSFVEAAVGGQESVTITYEFLPGTGTMSDFESGVPGVIVFGIMFIAISTPHTLVRENVTGTLRRLRLSRARARDLLAGIALAQMVVALVQIPVIFGIAMLFGFRGNGSLLLAMGIGLLLSLAAVGVGLIVACFARNDGEAANLGGGVAVMMVLISGALFPLPDAPIVTVFGRTLQAYDLLPPTHATEAMRRVLVLGDGPGAIAFELASLAILSLIFLVAGVSLYQRLRMRNL